MGTSASQIPQIKDFSVEVQLGNVPGFSYFTKFGRNPDIDVGTTPEDIWNGGGLYTGQPVHSAPAETIEVFSSDAADAAAGTGARTVRVIGLDENWDEQEEDFTLNGVTPVVSITLWRRAFRAFVLTAGSSGENEGIITARHTTTIANVFMNLPIAQNQTTIAAYTVPNSKTFELKRIKNQIGRDNGSSGACDYSLRVREEGGVYRAIRYETITTNFADSYTLEGAIVLPARTDILVRCESVSDNDISFSAAFEGLLIDI